MKGLNANIIKYIVPVLILTALVSCKRKISFPSPLGYDFNNAEKFNMPESLLEISGIAFYKDKGDTVQEVELNEELQNSYHKGEPLIDSQQGIYQFSGRPVKIATTSAL